MGDTADIAAPMPEPKLLKQQSVKRKIDSVPISSYYFIDEDDFVKLYVPLEGDGTLEAEAIKFQLTERELNLKVSGLSKQSSETTQELNLTRLYGEVDKSKSKYRILKNRKNSILITLHK